ELDPSLDGDRLAELRYQLSEAQIDGVEPQLERGLLAQVGLPRDPQVLALPLRGGLPAIPVGVLDLVEREALAMVKEVLVVAADRVVDLAAEEHRPSRRGLLAEDVAPTPVLRAEDEAVVARVREVRHRLAVVAGRQPPRDLDPGGELRRAGD